MCSCDFCGMVLTYVMGQETDEGNQETGLSIWCPHCDADLPASYVNDDHLPVRII